MGNIRCGKYGGVENPIGEEKEEDENDDPLSGKERRPPTDGQGLLPMTADGASDP